MALEACPFCGSYAVKIEMLAKRTKHIGECVCCYSCGAEVGFPPSRSGYYRTEKRWNERANIQTPKMYGLDEAVRQVAIQIAREYAKEEIEQQMKTGRKTENDDGNE